MAHHQSSTKAKKQNKKRLCSSIDNVEMAILSKLHNKEECDAEEHFGLHVASIL